MTESFTTPEQLSQSIFVAKIYLGSRREDFEKFSKEFTLSSRDGKLYHSFENGYEANLYRDGTVSLLWPNYESGKSLDTFEQFAAYYIAKFW